MPDTLRFAPSNIICHAYAFTKYIDILLVLVLHVSFFLLNASFFWIELIIKCIIALLNENVLY